MSIEENEDEPNKLYKLKGKNYFLIGKDKKICDIIIDSSTISRQHSVIQFRKTIYRNKELIIPYIFDLNSTNGTYLNGVKINENKYYELKQNDIINFGNLKNDFIIMKKEKDI